MSRILDYPEITSVSDADFVLVDGVNGTKKIKATAIGGGSGEVVNPNYAWFCNDDRTLAVRLKLSDNSFRWYFNDFPITTTSAPFQTLPTQLTRFIKNNVGVGCEVTDNPNVHHGVIGFYADTIRLWNDGLTYNQIGVVKGIMESTDTGMSYQNEHTWSEPTFDPING